MSTVVDKFLKYVTIDTQSDEDSTTSPSTEKQKDLARLLVGELKEMGASDVRMDEEYGYVYATIPSTLKEEGKEVPVIGFIAHMDTSPAVSGKDVKPRIVENYDGKDIVLNQELNIILPVEENPELLEYEGKKLIVTDGTTLLGADDKAGVAEIMTMAQTLLAHPEKEHGTIRIAFTPDEEVGRAAGVSNTGRRDWNSWASRMAFSILFLALPGCTLYPLTWSLAPAALKLSYSSSPSAPPSTV